MSKNQSLSQKKNKFRHQKWIKKFILQNKFSINVHKFIISYTIIKIPFAYSQWRSNTSEKNPQSLTLTTSKDDFQITLINFLIQMKFLFGMRKETRFNAVCSSKNKIIWKGWRKLSMINGICSCSLQANLKFWFKF